MYAQLHSSVYHRTLKAFGFEFLPSGPTSVRRKGKVMPARALFSVHSWANVYNRDQLSLTHKQLKVGIANQRHPRH